MILTNVETGGRDVVSRAWRSLLLHLLTGLITVSLIFWVLLGAGLRNSKGDFIGRVCLLLAGIVAFFIVVTTVNSRWAAFARWFVLALMGHAVSLQMIDAGNNVGYQHYQPQTEINPILLICFLVQTVLVIAGIKSRWSTILDWLRSNFKFWQILCICCIFIIFSSTVSVYISRYILELFFASFIQAVNLGNIVLLVWALPEDILEFLSKKFKKIFNNNYNEDSSVHIIRIDRFAIIAAIWVIVAASLLNYFFYDRHPHIPDEMIYYKHAEYLAEGVLTAPAPPVSEAFEVYLMQIDGERYYPVAPVGWPIVLSLGVLLGLPWMVNPLLTGLNLILIYLLFQVIFTRNFARISLLLLCFSPWYVFMGMNFMTHMSTLTFALCASLAIEKARRNGKQIWGWLAGCSVGAMSLIRPLEGLIVAFLLGLWSIGLGGKRLKVSAITGLVIGSMIVGSAVFFYNNYLTGNPMVFPLNAYLDQKFGPNSNALGFGPDRGMGWAIDPYPGHSPIDALVNANLNTFAINIELFGWSIGSLFFVALFLFSGTFKRGDYLMIAVIIVVFIPHFFYYFSGGPDFGARYWFVMLVPFIALTVRGIKTFEIKLRNGGVNHLVGARVKVGILSLCFFTLVNFFPWRAVDKYHNYRGMRPDIRELADEHKFGKSLVLIQGDSMDYPSAWFYNPVNLKANAPIYAWDKNLTVRTQLLNTYQDRPLWIINGPSITGRGFKVIAGPIQPGSFR